MSCSQRKIEANRRNSRKSTGPKTPEGKARSSRNAISHGLTAQLTPVVLDESQSEFDAFAQELFDDLRPVGAMQRTLVDRIIFVSWKLRRIPQIERALLTAGPNNYDEEDRRCVIHPDMPPEQIPELQRILDEGNEPVARDEENEPTATVGNAIRRQEKQVRFLQLYEMRLERSLHANLRELQRLKKMKNEADEEEDDDEEQSVGEAPTPRGESPVLRETCAVRATPAKTTSEEFKKSSEPAGDGLGRTWRTERGTAMLPSS